jgi:SHS2 domain-containing protein
MVNPPINSQTIGVSFSIAVALLTGVAIFITTQNKVGELERREDDRHIEQNKRMEDINADIGELKTGIKAITRLEVSLEFLAKNIEDLKFEIRQSNQKKQGN